MSLSIFLLTGLSTSSFFLANFLTSVIEKNEHTITQLNFAIAQENEAALLYAWKQSKQGSQNWQILAKQLSKNNGEIAYLLADYYLNKAYLGKKFSSQPEQAILWYQQAIRLNYPKASVALAQLYFQRGNVVAAQNILSELQVMEFSQYQGDDVAITAIILTIKIAISIGDVEFAKSLLIKFSSLLQADEIGASLLSAVEKYQVFPSIGGTNLKLDNNSVTCPYSIQIFATNLLHLAQVERLVMHFKDQPLNDLVCFSPVRYIPMSTLSCSTVLQSATLCDETKLDEVADSVATRYIGIMLPEGGANVHFGMLYFDAQDSIDVVEHEISHLLGFVDEYPLVKGHVKCRASQQQVFAQNIAVLQNGYQGERSVVRAKILKQLAWAEQIKKSTPILHVKDESLQNNQYWQLGTPEQFEQEVGLFRSQTCDNNSAKQQSTFNAFKPLSARTKLQYDGLNFPKQYIALLNKKSSQFLMPSFHYNIALAYYQQNKLKQANYWLEQAASWENDYGRRKKVRQGSF
ncbi:tetratricopeptide repeat protein [Candidatus Colwellia aromaticivorans]|uniref:tetratricopeptide repeat protein n=1 Tax=Candidatus Colwellia aromaticivorans TaxID=2267621 RepID=UPI000DF36814|nr:sel1 repeat family protein [Candidatus Colwellia aromaticivorans]